MRLGNLKVAKHADANRKKKAVSGLDASGGEPFGSEAQANLDKVFIASDCKPRVHTFCTPISFAPLEGTAAANNEHLRKLMS